MHRTWLVGVSTFQKFCAKNYGMQYSPTGGTGRSQEQKKPLKWLIRPTSFWRFFAPCPLVDLRCGPGAMKILPDVPLAILKVTFFMVKVARTPPSSPKWRGMVIIHQKGGIWADFLAIFSILWLPRAPHMVGSGLSLPKILCQKFWYAILTTRRRWKVPRAKKSWNG